MVFDRVVQFLESQINEDFKLITPLEYSNILVIYKDHVEWWDVVEQKDKNNKQPTNVKAIKADYLRNVPDEVLLNWEKKYIMLGNI